MKFFGLSITTVVLRFYLIMVLVIGALFSGFYWIAGLALPVFMSILLGLAFEKKAAPATKTARRVVLPATETERPHRVAA